MNISYNVYCILYIYLFRISLSYHLLLCVLDFVYHNLYLDRRGDLFSTATNDDDSDSKRRHRLPRLPSDMNRPSSTCAYKPAIFATQSSILEALCEAFDGTAIEAKGVKVRGGMQSDSNLSVSQSVCPVIGLRQSSVFVYGVFRSSMREAFC